MRKFKSDSVPEELLNQVIEAGRYAPSGGNNQSTHFIVVENKDILRELKDLAKEEFAKMQIEENMYKSLVHSITASKNGDYTFHYNCPVLIITANKKDYGNNIADCACALENMMLMANALDLGSVWINQLRWLNENPVILAKMKELGMADDERVYGALALGYADTEDGLPVRKPLDRTGNVVTYVK
ncbi:MAG: nitroreductase [Lachnospiraceae bacterium]|nr:nitroreductase [Lachnospiraceae bacterium]